MSVVTCPSCSFDNPAGFRYCGNCGRALTDDLPKTPPFISSPLYHPSQALSPEAFERFQLEAKKLRGERRNVAILFADLCGYTAMSRQIDPEDTFSLINRYLGVLIEKVYKYDGVIDKFTGDGIMALFGAPIAHENDAERAVRATIEMQDSLQTLNTEIASEMGVEIQVRMGVHYGSVVFGQVGINLTEALSVMDYTAIGDIVNLASRLENAAEPGTVLASQVIYQQTKALIDFQPIPPLVLKGYADPVSAYRVIGLKDKPGRARGLEGRQTPLVGRETEMATLSSLFQEAYASWIGRIVLVTGEPGLGKSRLTAELKKELSSEEIRILEGGNLSYRQPVSYWAFREILHAYFSFQDDDSHSQRQRKIRDRLAILGDDVHAAPLLEHLLSIQPADPDAARRLAQLDPEQLRKRTFVAIRDLFLAEARRRPLLLILEDLHWSDHLSLELVKYLMDIVPQAPLMLYCISRPGEGGAAEALREHAQSRYGDFFTAISLHPLTAVQSDQLLNALLTIPNLPSLLNEIVAQRAEGNPFYLEEIIRMLIAEGIIHQVGQRWELVPGAQFNQIQVPDTLQGLVMARFDRLSDEIQELLQVASVIGSRFSFRLLSSIVPQSSLGRQLQYLVDQDFIFGQEEGPDLVYAFRNAITPETIYRHILRQESAVIHGQVARTIEGLYRDRLTEHVETLAMHYASSRYQGRALYYLIRAAKKAARSFANQEALDYYRRALNLLNQVASTPQQYLDVFQGLGDVLAFVGKYQEARRRYEQALQFLHQNKPLFNGRLVSELERKIANTFLKQEDYDQALVYLAAALRHIQSASGTDWVIERARICDDLGRLYFRRGELQQAQNWLEKGLRLAERIGQGQVVASLYNHLSGVFSRQNQLGEASRWLNKSLEIRRQLGDLVGMAHCYNNLGIIEASQSHFEPARNFFGQSLELRTRIGDTEGVISDYLNLGTTHTAIGDLAEGEQALHNALTMAEKVGHNGSIGRAHVSLGVLWVQGQQWQTAIKHLEQSAKVFEGIGAKENLIDVYYFLGEAYLGLGELGRAKQWGDTALEIADDLGTRALEYALERARCLRLLSAIARVQHDWEMAEDLLRQSMTIFDSLGNQMEQARSYHELASLAQDQNSPRAARGYLQRARDLFETVGAQLERSRVEDKLNLLTAA